MKVIEMKTYYVRCKKCKKGMIVNVPNSSHEENLLKYEFICGECVGYVDKSELYQSEILGG